MRPAPPEDRQRIIDLYKGGMTRPAIARETGWSEGTVHNIIKSAGVQGAGRVTGIRMSAETETLILRLYDDGVEWDEIGRRASRDIRTITNVLKRNGRSPDRHHEIPDSDKARIPGLYKSGMDAPAIGRLLGCHSTTVYTVLRDAGIDCRPRGCANVTYFDEIDTPAKAYWLGFIGADGCVTGFKSGNLRLVVKLARKDRGHLETLHKELKASHPIRDFDDLSLGVQRPYSALTVYSPRLVNALVSHGITPRKTNELQPWDGPPDLMPHYWRGLVDGDGSITVSTNGVWISFTGSEAVVRAFLAWAHGISGTNASARKGTAGNRNYWTTQVGGTVGVLSVLWALYEDAPVALARKKALADLALHDKPLQNSLF